MDTQRVQEIARILTLPHEAALQNRWEILVAYTDAANKLIFKSLNGPLVHVAPMVVWLYQL